MEVDIKIPSVGESITEVTIWNWTKKDGSFVQKGEIVCELESDKITVEIVAPESGILKIIKKKEEIVSIGSIIGSINISDTQTIKGSLLNEATEENNKKEVKNKIEQNKIKGYPSPASRKIIMEKNLDPLQIIGTGKDGRIIKQDILRDIYKKKEEQKSNQKENLEEKSFITNNTIENDLSVLKKEKIEEVQIQDINSIQYALLKNWISLNKEKLTDTIFQEVSLYKIEKIRKSYDALFFEQYQIEFSFLYFFVKAVSQALKKFPSINTILDKEKKIKYYSNCNIGIKMNNVTPVIKKVENKSLVEIGIEIAQMREKANQYILSIEELLGGTFTIENRKKVKLSVPIINGEQTGILAIHQVEKKEVLVNGRSRIHPTLSIVFSYDLRIVDNETASNFLTFIKEKVEDPIRMFIDV